MSDYAEASRYEELVSPEEVAQDNIDSGLYNVEP
jgi:hypothetical protein